MKNYQLFVWHASLIIEALLFAWLMVQRTYKQLPWFVTFIAMDLIKGVVLLFTDKMSPVSYAPVWKSVETPEIVILVMCNIEAYEYIIGKRVERGLLAMLMCVSFMFGPIVKLIAPVSPPWSRVLQIEDLLADVTCVGLLFVFGWAVALLMNDPPLPVKIHVGILGVWDITNAIVYLALLLGLQRYWAGAIVLTWETLCFIAWSVSTKLWTLETQFD
jgi:hypothetical protein